MTLSPKAFARRAVQRATLPKANSPSVWPNNLGTWLRIGRAGYHSPSRAIRAISASTSFRISSQRSVEFGSQFEETAAQRSARCAGRPPSAVDVVDIVQDAVRNADDEVGYDASLIPPMAVKHVRGVSDDPRKLHRNEVVDHQPHERPLRLRLAHVVDAHRKERPGTDDEREGRPLHPGAVERCEQRRREMQTGSRRRDGALLPPHGIFVGQFYRCTGWREPAEVDAKPVRGQPNCSSEIIP